jgi:phage shock protein A
MDKENNIELLKAKIGNLEVQVSEYREIVKELSQKLEAYESKHGRVFVPARNTSSQK